MRDDLLTPGELNTILHSVFFAYQQENRSLLSEEANIALTSAISRYLARDLTGLSDRLKGRNAAEKLRSFAKLLVSSKLVDAAHVAKQGPDYLFSVDACRFALTMRNHKDGMAVICPWGLVALAIAARASGKSFRPASSQATDLGASTLIMASR